MVARPSMPRIWPRRDDRSPRISPMNSSGITTSTFMIGSSSVGWPFCMPSLAAIEPATALLADESADAVGLALDRLAIGDLRLADVRVDGKLAQHAVDDDLEVQLAHAGDDRLGGLLVGVDLERRVFLGELGERLAHL